MEEVISKIENCIYFNNDVELRQLLSAGVDPNLYNGWPIRSAARQGCYVMVKTLLQYGANPHLQSESGASTLQLAVYSGKYWETENWTFLLACCDSSQLADGAAVAIIFNNAYALTKIISTGRCNLNIPTTLTGKTIDQLIKGYSKSQVSVNNVAINSNCITPNSSPRTTRAEIQDQQFLTAPQPNRNLSPSVARFFYLTANRSSPTSPRSPTAPTSTTN